MYSFILQNTKPPRVFVFQRPVRWWWRACVSRNCANDLISQDERTHAPATRDTERSGVSRGWGPTFYFAAAWSSSCASSAQRFLLLLLLQWFGWLRCVFLFNYFLVCSLSLSFSRVLARSVAHRQSGPTKLEPTCCFYRWSCQWCPGQLLTSAGVSLLLVRFCFSVMMHFNFFASILCPPTAHGKVEVEFSRHVSRWWWQF